MMMMGFELTPFQSNQWSCPLPRQHSFTVNTPEWEQKSSHHKRAYLHHRLSVVICFGGVASYELSLWLITNYSLQLWTFTFDAAVQQQRNDFYRSLTKLHPLTHLFHGTVCVCMQWFSNRWIGALSFYCHIHTLNKSTLHFTFTLASFHFKL